MPTYLWHLPECVCGILKLTVHAPPTVLLKGSACQSDISIIRMTFVQPFGGYRRQFEIISLFSNPIMFMITENIAWSKNRIDIESKQTILSKSDIVITNNTTDILYV